MEERYASGFDAILKVVVVGSSGTGKSSIVLRYTDDAFVDEMASTIGVDFKVKTVTMDDKRIKLTIWDTAGQERFRTLAGSYYRSAQLAIVVYDVTDEASYDALETWIDELNLYSEHKMVKVLVGNKIDLKPRVVPEDKALLFATKREMLYIETSARTKVGIDDAFSIAVRQVMATDVLRQSAPSMVNVSGPRGVVLEEAGASGYGCC